MEKPVKSQPGKLQRHLEKMMLYAARGLWIVGKAMRRLSRKPRTVAENPNNLLPTLIKVFAAFTKVDGEVFEEEIDSSLGFLRYDYPDAVYSELRQLFRQALHEYQDLDAIAQKLGTQLSPERRILLGVQLYDLISKAGLKQEQIDAYYSFMSRLGMADQAIGIVYQLNATEQIDSSIPQQTTSPLEMLSFGEDEPCDVILSGLDNGQKLLAYRYGDLVIIKNLSERHIIVQGRTLQPNELCRIYANHRILIDDQVLTYQDLMFYFNAKKNVSTTQIFVAVNEDDEVRLEKSRTRDSCLEVTFGLRVRVHALKNVDAVLKGIRLKASTIVTATLDDKIIFHNDSELELSDLRRRARSYGGRFQLTPSKSTYLVSNNPGLLDEGDILLSPGPGGDVLLKISCDYEQKRGHLEVLQADRPITIRGIPIRNYSALDDGDTIRIDAGQLLRCNFTDRIIEEERNIIRTLEVRDVVCRFRNGELALDGISFNIQRGELVCIMGASGCGKSTLLRALSGQFSPSQGEVLLNSHSLYTHYESLKKYISYIPQFDAFDEHLTIEENLAFAAAIRAPHLSGRERNRRVESKLAELGLNERRRNIVGTPHRKTLSGGERKRLNIGLDMISTADVYLFDEPTSGLSSKDSEHVMEIIRAIAHNKIVLVTIHQPNSKIFQMFQKAILLDKGGKLVFFGTPQEMLKYFAEAEHQQHFGTTLGTCESCGTARPEFIFDVLETPLRDLSGDIIFEENTRGQLVPARRFSPEYWRDKYEAYRLIKDVQQTPTTPKDNPHPQKSNTPASLMRAEPFRFREEWGQFLTLFKRAFLSKLRNKINLFITLVMPPALALLIGIVLRYAENENGVYNFASAFHIPTYLFLAMVTAMFLGITNAVDDIIHDRPVLMRERNLDVRVGYYVCAKAITLSIFAVIQCMLFVWIGDAWLSLRGMFWIISGTMILTTISGIAIGLLVSALASDIRTAIIVIPFVLIPQMILAGAFIKYEEMNRNFDFVYAIRQLADRLPGSTIEPRSKLEVPIICELIPMRWSYEAIIYAQAKYNPLTARQRAIQTTIHRLIQRKNLNEAEKNRLDDLKELLAIVSGLQAPNAQEVDRRLANADKVIAGTSFDKRDFIGGNGVSAEQLYINQKISDLVAKAEMEQSDYRGNKHQNVFFGPTKEYFGIQFPLLPFNCGVLIVFSLLLFITLHIVLRFQIRLRVV